MKPIKQRRGLNKTLLILAALAGSAMSTASIAKETDPRLQAVKRLGRASAKLIDERTASVFGVTTNPAETEFLTTIVLYKAASLSSEHGFERFALLHQRGTVGSVNGAPTVRNIRILVIFLHPGETAKPLEDWPVPVSYFNNSDVVARMDAIRARY